MQRSRIVQTLNVHQKVRLGPSLAAALLDGLFEHPARVFCRCATRWTYRSSRLLKSFFRSLLEQDASRSRFGLAIQSIAHGNLDRHARLP